MEKAGGKLVGAYYTMGKYDGVIILEAPNDEVVMKTTLATLATASLGNIRTKTLKALPYEEGSKIMENL